MSDQTDSHYHMRIAPRAVFEAEASAIVKEIAGSAAGDDVDAMKEAYPLSGQCSFQSASALGGSSS